MSSNPNEEVPGKLTEANGAGKPKTTNAARQESAVGINGSGEGNSATAKAKPPQALDRWFDDQLNQLFNEVSSEPLPPDLAKLIGQLKAQSLK